MPTITDADALYMGTQQADAVYAGTTKVWPSWSPLSLPNLRGWYDASHTSTLTVVAPDQVTAWADKSGLGRTLVETGGAPNRPRTGVRTIGGRNALDFAGTPQTLSYVGTTGTTTLSTVYLVVVWDAGTNRIPFDGIGTGHRHAFLAVSGIWRHYQGVGSRVTGHVVDTTAAVIVGSFKGDGTSTIYKNGAVGSSGTSSGADPLDAGWRVGGEGVTNTSSNAWAGGIGEVIVCAGTDTTTDRQLTEAYLKAKWSTP